MYGYGVGAAASYGAACCRPVAPVVAHAGVGVGVIAIAILILIALGLIF